MQPKREARFVVRLTDKEMAKLNELVALTPLSREKYVRTVLLGTVPKTRPTRENFTVISQLSAIGNNINQIAKKANTTGYIDAAYLKEELKKLNKFYTNYRGYISS